MSKAEHNLQENTKQSKHFVSSTVHTTTRRPQAPRKNLTHMKKSSQNHDGRPEKFQNIQNSRELWNNPSHSKDFQNSSTMSDILTKKNDDASKRDSSKKASNVTTSALYDLNLTETEMQFLHHLAARIYLGSQFTSLNDVEECVTALNVITGSVFNRANIIDLTTCEANIYFCCIFRDRRKAKFCGALLRFRPSANKPPFVADVVEMQHTNHPSKERHYIATLMKNEKKRVTTILQRYHKTRQQISEDEQFLPLDLSKNSSTETVCGINQPTTTQRLQHRSQKSSENLQKLQRKSRHDSQLPQLSKKKLKQAKRLAQQQKRLAQQQQQQQQPPPSPPLLQRSAPVPLQKHAQLLLNALVEPIRQIVQQSFEPIVKNSQFSEQYFVQSVLQSPQYRQWRYVAIINDLLRYIPANQLLLIFQQYNETSRQMLNLLNEIILAQLYQQQVDQTTEPQTTEPQTTKPQTTTLQPLFITTSPKIPLLVERAFVEEPLQMVASGGVDRTAQFHNNEIYRNSLQNFQTAEQLNKNQMFSLQNSLPQQLYGASLFAEASIADEKGQELCQGIGTMASSCQKTGGTSSSSWNQEASVTESVFEEVFVKPRSPSRGANTVFNNSEILNSNLTSSISALVAHSDDQCPQAQQQQQQQHQQQCEQQ